MGAKTSTNNHSTVPLSRIMYLKNITVKLYMRGAHLTISCKITGHLVRHYQSIKVTDFFRQSEGRITDRNIDTFQLPYDTLLLYHKAI